MRERGDEGRGGREAGEHWRYEVQQDCEKGVGLVIRSLQYSACSSIPLYIDVLHSLNLRVSPRGHVVNCNIRFAYTCACIGVQHMYAFFSVVHVHVWWNGGTCPYIYMYHLVINRPHVHVHMRSLLGNGM